jgi:site-specific recombinase XerD
MKTTNEFPRILSGFLLNELPAIQNQSGNTIASYRDTYKRLLGYMQDEVRINAQNVRISDLSAVRIAEFLNWLEHECGNSVSTRNQRLAAIHSLFQHIQVQAPEYMFQCQQVRAIPFKKTEKRQVGFLSEDETKALLAMPDAATRKGRRDQALLCLLYDSGARVQELADLRVGDLRLDSPSQVKLTGKGRKTRSVPLMDKTAALLRQYLREQRLDNPSCYEHPLFFNSQRKKLTRQGIAYVLKKYAGECGISEISPHRIRHTKAMHLTEADINPVFIRDFLGHTDLKVTEVYSKTSVKMKRAALEKMSSGKHDVVPDKIGDWTEDKSLMDWLAKLKREN